MLCLINFLLWLFSENVTIKTLQIPSPICLVSLTLQTKWLFTNTCNVILSPGTCTCSYRYGTTLSSVSVLWKTWAIIQSLFSLHHAEIKKKKNTLSLQVSNTDNLLMITTKFLSERTVDVNAQVRLKQERFIICPISFTPGTPMTCQQCMPCHPSSGGNKPSYRYSPELIHH